jgi:hypothetical protein
VSARTERGRVLFRDLRVTAPGLYSMGAVSVGMYAATSRTFAIAAAE